MRTEELKRGLEDVETLPDNLPPCFCLLVNLSQLETMDLDCKREIDRVTELFDRKW